MSEFVGRVWMGRALCTASDVLVRSAPSLYMFRETHFLHVPISAAPPLFKKLAPMPQPHSYVNQNIVMHGRPRGRLGMSSNLFGFEH
jgi:hypothetical protein